MKIVVTGGAGYIGGSVAALLIENGHEVTVLDNLSEGSQASIPQGATFVKGDVADFGTLFRAEDSVEAVLHFAASIAAGESMSKPEKYWQNNTINSLKLLEALRGLSIKKLIFSSTAAVYGNPIEVPITEDAPKNPTNTYGMTKLAVDMAITSECVAHGLAATSLRYFNVAGAHGRQGERHNPETHIIPLALKAADEGEEFTIFGNDYPTPDGTCVRDYIHVRDLAQAHLLALQNLQANQHTIYNLGNGNGFSNKEVLDVVQKVTGKNIKVNYGERREGDPAVLVASSELAKEKLGWAPEKTDLTEIVADAWNFLKNTNSG